MSGMLAEEEVAVWVTVTESRLHGGQVSRQRTVGGGAGGGGTGGESEGDQRRGDQSGCLQERWQLRATRCLRPQTGSGNQSRPEPGAAMGARRACGGTAPHTPIPGRTHHRGDSLGHSHPGLWRLHKVPSAPTRPCSASHTSQEARSPGVAQAALRSPRRVEGLRQQVAQLTAGGPCA